MNAASKKVHLQHGGRSACRYGSRPSSSVQTVPFQRFAGIPQAMRCAECGSQYRFTISKPETPSDPSECPKCSGPGILLGNLGSTTHYRCRNCGWGFTS